jgi:hypothetical protein
MTWHTNHCSCRRRLQLNQRRRHDPRTLKIESFALVQAPNPCTYTCIHALNESDRTFEPQITTATRLPR